MNAEWGVNHTHNVATGVTRGHIRAVLLANCLLWTAALFVTGNSLLAGAAAVSLISIGSLLLPSAHRS